jgi:hypothetical protein
MEGFSLTTDWIIVIAAVAIFYVRLAMLRGQKRKQERQEMLSRMKKGSKNKKEIPEQSFYRPRYQVTTWWLVGVGVILMCIGIIDKNMHWFPSVYLVYWWIPTALGILAFTFCFK